MASASGQLRAHVSQQNSALFDWNGEAFRGRRVMPTALVPQQSIEDDSRVADAAIQFTGAPQQLAADVVRDASPSFRSLPCRGRRRAVSAARLKRGRTPERYPRGFVERVFLVHALALVASAIVSMRFAFYLRNHFDFSDHAHTPNLIRRRQQRAFAPALPPPCAERMAIAAQSRADPDRDR
jgi:hypothetical protein